MLTICGCRWGLKANEETGRVMARPGCNTNAWLSVTKATTRNRTLINGVRLKSSGLYLTVRCSFMVRAGCGD